MPSRQLTDLVTVVGPDDPDAATPITVRLVPDNGACYAPWNESTKAVLMAMADVDFAGKTVLDFGTGSGILAIVAAKLGATTVLAVEIDPAVEDAAIANHMANGNPLTFGPMPAGSYHDIALANLGQASVLLDLLPRCDMLIGTAETGRELRGLIEYADRLGRTLTRRDFAEGWAVVQG